MNLIIMAGLLICCIGCLWSLVPRRKGADASGHSASTVAVAFRKMTRHVYLVPSVFILSGFVFSWSSSTAWFLGTAMLVVGIGWYATHIAERGRPGGAHGSIRAVIGSTTVLLLLGSLVTVRIVVATDPAAPYGGGFTPRAVAEGVNAIVLPLVATITILGGWHLLTRRGRGTPAFSRGRLAPVLLFLVLVAAFLLPKFADGGSADLTVGPVATPEYGKIIFALFLAVIVARNFERFGGLSIGAIFADVGKVLRTRSWRHFRRYLRALRMKTRHFAYPIAAFGVVGGLSAMRHDFGSIVPTFAATAAITWIATRRTTPHAANAGWRGLGIVRTAKAYRLFAVTFAVLFAGAAALTLTSTDYITERAKVWADPWVYRWDSGCAPPESPPLNTPPGVQLCQVAMAADVEGNRSQIAKSLAAVADGGLFGRGIQDYGSRVVPAGPTDFVLAVMWDKLGGITVVLTALLILILGAAIIQATRSRDDDPTIGSLFGAGLAGLVVGQYLFVFAATLNLIPHSGIPAPFLSRGGQATLALLAGIVMVLAFARRDVTAEAAMPETPKRYGLYPLLKARAGTLAGALVCLLLAVLVTLNPYVAPLPGHSWLPDTYPADRQICPARQDTREDLLSPPPDPRMCSTDRLAYSRTVIEIDLDGAGSLRLNRESGRWEPRVPMPGGLVAADLNGLVRVGAGQVGVIDRSFPKIVDGTAGSRLAWRMLPPDPDRPADGSVRLTIVPRLQHLLAEALRKPGPEGKGPLAGGMVAIEARTGRILAAVTVPVSDPVFGPPGDGSAAKDFVEQHSRYGVAGAGGLDGTEEDPLCGSGDSARQECWRWLVRQARTEDTAVAAEDRRRYVGPATPEKDLPPSNVNRALGKQYGLGSTFKVVIAAAHLRAGGKPDGLIEAPVSIRLSQQVITSPDGGPCRGAVNGRMTLTQALAVSCNTAFVRLAQKLGWSRIAEQARLFGFHIGPCSTRVPAWTTPPLGGAYGSCVPESTDAVAIGNNALGGQDVVGTPLQIAAMMAAVANQGRAIAPTLVSELTYPDTGRREGIGPGPQTQSLSPEANARLVEALALTAESGTMRGLAEAAGTPMWVKTGTNDVVPPGSFVKVNSWLGGFLETGAGPVAFAVVQEAPDSATGAARNRHLATLLAKALVGQ